MRLAKITIDTSMVGQTKFKFSISIVFSKDTIDIKILFGII
jgi:hypothetical protein